MLGVEEGPERRVTAETAPLDRVFEDRGREVAVETHDIWFYVGHGPADASGGDGWA